ncbi:MAG: phage tail assembly protein [Desulfovibrio sp.]|jgi:hypothetical protein|nr:phage tail assembly protein [Desulfovibrio sp.]
MSDPKAQRVIVKLDYPVELPDGTRAEVAIRRPTIGDMLDCPVNDRTGLKEETALMARLCGLCVEDVRALDMADYDKLQTELLRFRGVSGN